MEQGGKKQGQSGCEETVRAAGEANSRSLNETLWSSGDYGVRLRGRGLASPAAYVLRHLAAQPPL